MHRETTISREIKLLKNKFELLEKSRQFRSILQKSNSSNNASDINEDLASGLDPTNASRSEANSVADSLTIEKQTKVQKSTKSVRIKLPKLRSPLGQLFSPILNLRDLSARFLKRSNRVATMTATAAVPRDEVHQSKVTDDGEVVKPLADGLQVDSDQTKEVNDSSAYNADGKAIGSEMTEVETTKSPTSPALATAPPSTTTNQSKVASIVKQPLLRRLFKKK